MGRCDAIVHGTTIADNTLIEMNGAVTGLMVVGLGLLSISLVVLAMQGAGYEKPDALVGLAGARHQDVAVHLADHDHERRLTVGSAVPVALSQDQTPTLVAARALATASSAAAGGTSRRGSTPG